MPGLSSNIHLDMYAAHKRKHRSLPGRILRAARAARRELFTKTTYGLEWGDPESVEPLRYVRDHFVLPYVNAGHCAVEIGPGGGRWTRYLLGFQKLYVVDYHSELLGELRRQFSRPSMTFVKNSGTDFPGIPPRSIDFLFSFGTFVHLDLDLISAYLTNIGSIIKPGANVVLHYADKTKVLAQMNQGFSDNTPEKMTRMVESEGFAILEEDRTSLWHSSIMRFTRKE